MRSVVIPIVIVSLIAILSWGNAITEAAQIETKLDEVVSAAEYNENLKVYKVALSKYREAIKLDPENIHYYHKYMEIAKIMSLKDEFEKASLKTIERFPNDDKAYVMLIKYYFENNNTEAVVDLSLEAKKNLDDVSEFEDMYFESAYKYIFFSYEYSEVRGYVGSYAPVLSDGKWGLLNNFGRYQIEPEHDFIGALSSGKAPVINQGDVYFVDKYNDKVLAAEENVDKVYSFVEGLAVVEQNGVYGYATSKFELRDMKWDFATSYLNGVAAIKKDGKWAIRDFDRNMLTDFIFDDVLYDENLICSNGEGIFVKKDGLYYLVGLDGKKIIVDGFEDAKPFTSEGIAPVKVDGLWGFISSQGEKIIKPQYEDANAFQIGIAPVKQDGQWFYINKNQRVVIEGDFEEARSFSGNGIAPVKIDGNWTFIQLLRYK